MEIKNNPWFMLPLLILMSSSLKSHVSFGANNTISSTQSLSGDQTIVSPGGVFELGFFKPGKSTNYYIGMWYKTVSQQTALWVANREKPVRDIYSSVLKISDGNLVLFDESQVAIWSTNISSSTNSSSVVAVLLDDGNLVLRDGIDSSTALWQSFDHPTDTWLPGIKFSFNKRTNQSQRFIAWRSQDDPAPGLFSLELNPSDTKQIVGVWNRSQQYWTSGPWDEQTMSFSLVPEMRMASMYNLTYNFSYVSNENESYFLYSFYNNSTVSRNVMDVSGQLKYMTWLNYSENWNLFFSQPRQQCEVYALCGAFGSCNENSFPFCDCLSGFKPKSPENWEQQDYSGGCVRQDKLQYCDNSSVGNGNGDQFLESLKTSFPTNPRNVMADSIKDCRSTCLKNCSCTAYAYEEDSGCSIWIGELLNLQQLGDDDTNGKTLFIRTAAPSKSSSSIHGKRVVIAAVSVSAGLLVLGLIVFIMGRKRRAIIAKKSAEGSLMAFGYKDLQKATKNFCEELGKGSFGSVFKGTLPDTSVIAVKKLEGIKQGEKQFRSEVSTIGRINHVNLVRLRGFCSQGSRKLLVYDYMPNGSLDAHLFHEKDSNVLDWRTRYQIALGAARGLAYLHEECRDNIIHCDIKPENILLDADFCPKLADFGLAKLLGREFSRVLTSMRGTLGYLAPEWISGVAITPKADVFSYGMMVLEIVSGRRNFQHSSDEEGTFFPTWAARQVAQGNDVIKLLDRRLNEDANIEELSRICKVACWCIQDDEVQRPSMSQVVQILEGVSDVSLPPIPRFLQAFLNDQEQPPMEQISFFTA